MTSCAPSLPGLDPESFVLVTGGGGVLGSAVAERLSSLGVGVGLVGRDRRSLDAAATRCTGGPAHVAVADVGDRRSITAAVDGLASVTGRLTGLVHMAAVIAPSHPSDEVAEEEVAALLRINVGGTFETVRACTPHLATGGGSVVLVSSVAAYGARTGSPIYGSTKAAVLRLTRQFAHELGPSNVRVNCISPGQTPTRMREWDTSGPAGEPVPKGGASGKVDRLPLRRRGEADDYVGPVLFLLSELSGYVTGVDLPVDGGYVATAW